MKQEMIALNPSEIDHLIEPIIVSLPLKGNEQLFQFEIEDGGGESPIRHIVDVEKRVLEELTAGGLISWNISYEDQTVLLLFDTDLNATLFKLKY